ncbi:hypothetical protein ACQCN2_20035 [Brevibacillus ginsengisoli]|uniref:hypothetical protein n=1 Tax=Brevibacillus ginsengisoli TaxID=363854 RepID=UPI003CF10ED9
MAIDRRTDSSIRQFELSDLEKLHLALDMAQRFIRGEGYHGDKPQILLQDFDRMLEKIRDLRHEATEELEQFHHLIDTSVQDADHGKQNPSI